MGMGEEMKTFIMKRNNMLLLSYLFNTFSFFLLSVNCLVIFKNLLLGVKMLASWNHHPHLLFIIYLFIFSHSL